MLRVELSQTQEKTKKHLDFTNFSKGFEVGNQYISLQAK